MKKLFIFFSFFASFAFSAWAIEVQNCNNEISKNSIKKLDSSKPQVIKVVLNNYRKWQKNNIRILTERSRIIPAKYKKRFNAKIEVTFQDNLKCIFNARVRAHGDFKDHIYLDNGAVVQSLDIHLKNGHINGITKFKLFIPQTRGKASHEIFITELLREFNFIAPRTSFVDVKINEKITTMLFQEKAAKELLEFNLRREGPLLEGDERYMFPAVSKFPDNRLSNMSIGMLPAIEEAVQVQLAKQTNTQWNLKGENHSNISFHSLTLLNRAFLLYSSQFKNPKNNFNYYNYNLDNSLLALNNKENILKLDTYNLIVFAADGWHGMVPHNRKFYWNSLENYFEPIYYDGNVNLDLEPRYINLPYSNNILISIDETEKHLDQINTSKFTKKINSRGLNYDLGEVEEKFNILKANLGKLKIKILNLNQELIESNKNIKVTEKMWEKYINLILNFNPKTNLILKKPDSNNFFICKKNPIKCSTNSFTDIEVKNLLESRLNFNGSPYQYIGEYSGINFLNNIKSTNYKKLNFKDSTFYYDKNITFNFNEENKEFDIFQNKPGARAFFYHGKLEGIKINFNGYDNKIESKVPNYPFDQRGLTGCLSLVSLKVTNIEITSKKSNCEDSVNLINVKGDLKKINIEDSFSDGLDVDFSKVMIDKIYISLSGNDCVDFSSGNYSINELKLIDCGDKGLSVGEKSFLKLNKIHIENSNIGIASKDSSVTKLTDAYLKNLKTCVSAYNKKQEFSGGILEIKNINCQNYTKKINKDINSQITIENDI
jgi:hypothetical protein